MYPNVDKDIRAQIGEKNFDNMMSEAQKASDRRQLEIQKAQDKAQELKDAREAGNGITVPLTSDIVAQINKLPADKQAVLKPLDGNTQAALMAVAFGNGEVDLEKNFPSRLTKGAPGLNTQQALGVIHQLNPDWSEQTYGVIHDAYKDATSTRAGSLGSQAGSLNNFIGHAAEAQRINNQFYNTDPKLFKGPINELAKLGYGTQAVALGNAIEVVNAEFLNLVNAGHVPSSDEKAAHATLVSPSSTVGQINAAIGVMSHMAGVRAYTIDSQYENRTGNHFPNLIYPGRLADAQALGMDVSQYYSGGRIGGSGNGPAMRNTQTGTQNGNQNVPAGNRGNNAAPLPQPKNTIHMKSPDGKTELYVPLNQYQDSLAHNWTVIR